MEKLTPERLAEIAQIVLEHGRFDRFMSNGREMNLADWQSCLEMAMYCELDISDWQAVISRLSNGLTPLDDMIECVQFLDKALAAANKEGGYFRRFEQQLKQCRERHRLILRISQRFSQRPMFHFYLQGERIARAVYGGGSIVNEWALFGGQNSLAFLGSFQHIEYAELELGRQFKATMQPE